MTDLYDQRIDEMRARERDQPLRYSVFGEMIAFSNCARNRDRLAAYKRKCMVAALKELQRLGQEWDNG